MAARLRTLWNTHAGAAAVDSRHLDFSTQSGRGNRNWHAAVEVQAIALKKFVLLHLDKDVKVAGWTTAHTCFTFTGKTDACACFNTRRDVDREGFFLLHAALAVAHLTGVLDGLTHTVTGRAGAFDGEETLLRTDFPHAGTRRAGLRFCATLGTCTVA